MFFSTTLFPLIEDAKIKAKFIIDLFLCRIKLKFTEFYLPNTIIKPQLNIFTSIQPQCKTIQYITNMVLLCNNIIIVLQIIYFLVMKLLQMASILVTVMKMIEPLMQVPVIGLQGHGQVKFSCESKTVFLNCDSFKMCGGQFLEFSSQPLLE